MAGQDASVIARFDATGFRDGYGRVWLVDDNISVTASAFAFASDAGARQFLELQRTEGQKQFSPPSSVLATSIPQSFGFVGLLAGQQPGAAVVFAYRHWTFEVSMTSPADQLDVGRLRQLAMRQYDLVRTASR